MTPADIRILVVDDQELVRAGFRVILESEPGMTVVGEAVDGADAVDRALQLRPDVICMDVQMPGVDGLEATRRITANSKVSAAVLILTTFDRDDYLFAALAAGASGFLLKNSSPERMIEAVRILAGGDALLSPDVTRRVIERFTRLTPAAPASPVARADAATATDPPGAVDSLTARETEVLGLLARGRSNAEIASELYLGEATVKTHVSRVLMKLGLRDRIQAVVYAYENGIVRPDA
ncbi:MAG: response regulator transcription factor [Microbacteriaceae bacterium]